MPNEQQPTNFAVEVFHDGACPLCAKEMRWLRRLDRNGRIRFTDIADPAFDPATLGMTFEALMARIHGRLPDGRIIEGVEVFRQLYAAAGFPRLAAFTRVPGIAQLLGAGYWLFAKNRLRLTGRCLDGQCTV
ncbi:MAG: DUF393 domain-containing protein, partial [Pseudomonadota bacterium]